MYEERELKGRKVKKKNGLKSMMLQLLSQGSLNRQVLSWSAKGSRNEPFFNKIGLNIIFFKRLHP